MTRDNGQHEVMRKLRGACAPSGAQQIEAELKSLGCAPLRRLPNQDLCEVFLSEVLKNKGTVDCASNRSEAVQAVAKYLQEQYRTRKLVAGNDPRLAAMPWRDGGVLPRFGGAEQGENASVSYAKLGVAETGSIVTFTGKANPAANNLLVDSHIVLLDVGDLVASLDEAWERIDAYILDAGRPRGLNFISGPSSTADIEGHLVTGAHGPRSWHVILMGDVPATTLGNARALVE